MSTFHEKLLAVQAELKAPKDHKSPLGYNYRSCEDILEAVKPLLKEKGLVLFLSDSVELIGTRFYIKATATLLGPPDAEGDVPSLACSAYAREEEEKKGTDAAKITGAASSYARKYALNGLFCIDDTKDADSQDNRPAPAQPPAARRPTPAAKPATPKMATLDQVQAIEQLAKESSTNLIQLYEHFDVKNQKPTHAQAMSMIGSLNLKLKKQAEAIGEAMTDPMPVTYGEHLNDLKRE